MANDTASISGDALPVAGVVARYARWLVPLVYAGCALAYLSDLTRANNLAYGLFYVPLVATAVFHERSRGVWVLTAIACLLVVTGAFLPVIDPDIPDLIGNRVLSIISVLATAAFVRYARATQERLAAQTRRAEAAERIKTQVFTKLSEEMRTPLHGLLGLLNLMLATCRSDQSEALGRVRNGGKQLLDTIDNLIDLTQLEDHVLHLRPVNVGAILREAADSGRGSADEHGVAIEIVPSMQADVLALGDSWAVRRILDNLIANAILTAPPRSTVSVTVDRTADVVTASVADNGIVNESRLVAAAQIAGGAGLTLSERLASAMNGRLTADDEGVSLSLPAA